MLLSSCPLPTPAPSYGDGSGRALSLQPQPVVWLLSVCSSHLIPSQLSLKALQPGQSDSLSCEHSLADSTAHPIKLSSVDSGCDSYLLQEPLTVSHNHQRYSPSIPSETGERDMIACVFLEGEENASLTGKRTFGLYSLQWHHCHLNTPGSTGQRSGGGVRLALVSKQQYCLSRCEEGQLSLTALGNVTKGNVIFKVWT